jgi:rare lipoprotein A
MTHLKTDAEASLQTDFQSQYSPFGHRAIAAGLIGVALSALAACSNGRSSTQTALAPRPMSALNTNPTTTSASASRSVAASEVRANPAPRTKVASGYKVGKPYRIGANWYVPREDPTYDQTGRGSWYGADFHGRKTANGELYDMNAMTAAHTTLPLPSYVDVTNVANGKTVRVRVNDRGPYVAGRIIDMSRAAARELGYEGQGTAQLRVRYAGRAPLDPRDGGGNVMTSDAGPTDGSRSTLKMQPYGLGLGAGLLGTRGDTFADARHPSGTEGWTTHEYRRSLAGEPPLSQAPDLAAVP